VTISSGAGVTGINLGVSLYGAGKGGAIAFMRHLAIENAKAGITANCLALGLMDNKDDREATEHLARTVPVGRLGTPEDVGAAVVYLVSDEAAWLTAQTIHLDGGSLPT
jgi:NAD(P)-dependent dehydrogenase (short-subunit alcohol dehydrogenase family)